jgi:hydrogenase expression/formation protein HypC
MCLGIPGQIVAIINADDALATVDIAGVRRPVNISFVIDDRSANECIGDWVLVHVGFAMSRIDVDEAARTLALLEELGEMQAELEAMQVDATLPLPLREGVGGRVITSHCVVSETANRATPLCASRPATLPPHPRHRRSARTVAQGRISARPARGNRRSRHARSAPA